MTEIGAMGPNFTLPANEGAPITLSDFQGKKNVVLSFHIYSFTGGSTHQVSSFRVHNEAFEETDTQVLGISCDSRPSQKAFSSSLGGIPYPILADFYPHGEISKAYGVFNDQNGTPLRAIVVIDKSGVVQFSQTYKAATDLAPQDILSVVKNL